MKHRWTHLPKNELLEGQFVSSLNASPLLARCLINRGINDLSEAEHFLSPKLKHLADPFLLPNMKVAVERLFTARSNGETTVIFGDYDVDGVTSTTLLSDALTSLGWKVDWYLPHRMDEGYGLTQAAIENCVKEKPHQLMLSVDCGSNAVESIAWLSSKGIDTIVLDHHQVADPHPAAVALVNPQLQSGDKKPFAELCTAGLAFKLLHALVKHGRELGEPEFASFDIRPFLDLVALGTIADIVPLQKENRLLVPAGLKVLNKTQRPGLAALKEVSGITGEVGGQEVGFTLGPRLNAAGRMETASDSLKLLLSPDLKTATHLAKNLDAQNRERQRIDRSISDQILADLSNRFDPEEDFALIEGELLWHIGVVGIVASRVLRKFYRPTFILGGEGGLYRGSGRSIEGFDLAAALRQCDDILIAHGGHAMAAGLTIEEEHLPEFKKRMNQIAKETIPPELLIPELKLDSEATLADLTLRKLEELQKLEPTGRENPPVSVSVSGLLIVSTPFFMGKEKQHVKFDVSDGTAESTVVWWNAGESQLPTSTFSVACEPSINEFRGSRSPQLRLLDWKHD